MKININSWHYKFIDKMNWDHSKSLCIYFWQVVGASFFLYILLPTIVILCVAFLFLLVPCGFSLFLQIITDWQFGTTPLSNYLWSLASGYLVIITSVIVYFVYKKLIKGNLPKSTDNLLVSYIKAKKRRICPMIEFTKGEK